MIQGKMKTTLIAATILLSSTLAYAHYEHYSVANQSNSRGKDIPCNYGSVGEDAFCYVEKVNTIKSYFRSVPSRMRKKGFSNGKIARFKREQKVFEKRVHNICENITCYAQGSGCGLILNHCYYLKYRPRFLKLKHMLGEPHPVRKK